MVLFKKLLSFCVGLFPPLSSSCINLQFPHQQCLYYCSHALQILGYNYLYLFPYEMLNDTQGEWINSPLKDPVNKHISYSLVAKMYRIQYCTYYNIPNAFSCVLALNN